MLCLPKTLVDKFVTGLKEGKLNPEDLTNFPSSEARRNYLAQFVGEENSKAVNALFESKLLMKNQNNAMITWVKSVAGLKPAIRRDLIDKINKLGKVLTPEEEKDFLKDLTSTRLGTEINREQAEVISKLADEFNKAKADPNSGLKYGATEVALNNYVNDIRLANEKQTVKETLGLLRDNPAKESIRIVSDIAGAAKGMKASLDDSAIFRQGWKTMFTNPQIWAKNAVKTFDDIYQQLKLKPSDTKVVDGIKAEIYSRPNSRSGLYKKMKLDVGNLEEAYPSSLPEKIPLLGRLYQASQAAYTGFLYRVRADIADKLIDMAEKSGVNIADKAEAEGLGRLINSMTGRGSLGGAEKVGKTINTIFFSPKMLKSQIDFFTMPFGVDTSLQKVTPFARKEAAKNILKVVSGIATILSTANAINPDLVEWDARSADFGKIRTGNTRFDVSGGLSPLVVLATRFARQSSKSSTSGKVTEINERDKKGNPKFGSKTGGDLFFDFMENKYSPMFSVLKQLRDQQTFDGKKPTLGSLVIDSTLPLTIDNIYGASQDEKAANLLLIGIAETLGLSSATYGQRK